MLLDYSFFLNSLKSTRLQNGVAQVQDGGVFGLEYLANQIRLANYGNVENRILNDETSRGGVVLTTGLPTQSNVNLAVGNGIETVAFDKKIVTKSDGLSNVNIASDQLTIQFVAPSDMHNCEGQDVFKGDRVVQRYFLRRETQKANHDNKVVSLGLACVASGQATSRTTVNAQPKSLSDFGTSLTGEVVIPNVDYFGILLGARTGASYRYYTIDEYNKATKDAREATPAQEIPSIEMIKLAVLIRSQDEVKTALITLTNYEILGRNISLNTPEAKNKTNKFVRNVYVTTIALRKCIWR